METVLNYRALYYYSFVHPDDINGGNEEKGQMSDLRVCKYVLSMSDFNVRQDG